MIANPEKFHLMFLSANGKDPINQQTINIKGISLKSQANFTLLGIDINNRLSFHGHINNLCRKAASQIIALKRLFIYGDDGEDNTDEIIHTFQLQLLSTCLALL